MNEVCVVPEHERGLDRDPKVAFVVRVPALGDQRGQSGFDDDVSEDGALVAGRLPLPAPHRASRPEHAASGARHPMALGEEPLADVPHLIDEVGRCHARPQSVVLTQRVVEDRENAPVATLVVAHLSELLALRVALGQVDQPCPAQLGAALELHVEGAELSERAVLERAAQRLRELARDPSAECEHRRESH